MTGPCTKSRPLTWRQKDHAANTCQLKPRANRSIIVRPIGAGKCSTVPLLAKLRAAAPPLAEVKSTVRGPPGPCCRHQWAGAGRTSDVDCLNDAPTDALPGASAASSAGESGCPPSSTSI